MEPPKVIIDGIRSIKVNIYSFCGLTSSSDSVLYLFIHKVFIALNDYKARFPANTPLRPFGWPDEETVDKYLEQKIFMRSVQTGFAVKIFLLATMLRTS